MMSYDVRCGHQCGQRPHSAIGVTKTLSLARSLLGVQAMLAVLESRPGLAAAGRKSIVNIFASLL